MNNEEIKEIIRKRKEKINFNKLLKVQGYYDKEDELLLDYITNLQEENERLKEIVENLTTMTVNGDRKQIKNTAQYKLDIYKSRNGKAIRYIERCRDYHRDIHKEERIFPDEITSLLMILNGGDEE